MAKTDPLAQLKDIHLPEPVSWWPLASGWYGLMFLVLLIVVIFSCWIYKRHAHSLAKKRALKLLQICKEHYDKDQNAQTASACISELLRRVALVYYPRSQVAGLSGENWIDFLNKTSKKIDFEPVKAMLLESPFKTAETINLKPLFTRAEQWIKQRGVPCLK